MVSVFPEAFSPLTCWAFPSRNSSSPSMSPIRNGAKPWSPMVGEKARSMECRYVSAVTSSFDGGLNWNPGRIVNVYVLPPSVGSGISSATTGWSVAPSSPSASGNAMSGAQVAASTSNARLDNESGGSLSWSS